MIFKCKVCGDDLLVTEGSSIVVCDACGTRQTVPVCSNEANANLFNRAVNLRLRCNFDKAQTLYEKIIENGSNDSEAYWGLVLCKYGIEYVEDLKSGGRIPTCHRTLIESVLSDEDYKTAITNADSLRRQLYIEEAKEIDRIQKDILALAGKEEPYDIFICYKEQDDSNGKRTQDSVMANEIYYRLTQEGFKVFYAAITLEDKIGSAYEPYIYAALNSAKVMLVIGTKPEYFNAAWVKNEWSRYLKIIASDRKKALIPCYKDMDAYDLPDEFAHLQAQDMGRIGFLTDIIHGVKKIIYKGKQTERSNAINNNVSYGNSSALLERAFIFLEDNAWNEADTYCERVLDQDPKNAEAYLCKLLIELKINSKTKLSGYSSPINGYPNYAKAMRFGSP